MYSVAKGERAREGRKKGEKEGGREREQEEAGGKEEEEVGRQRYGGKDEDRKQEMGDIFFCNQ